MGYLNDLILVLSERCDKEFRKQLNNENWFTFANIETHIFEVHPEVQTYAHDFVNSAEIKTAENGDKVYYWKQIKWYPEDDNRDNVLYSIIQNLSPMSEYLFISLGDNVDDIVIFGSYFNNTFGIGFERKITCNKGNIDELFK